MYRKIERYEWTPMWLAEQAFSKLNEARTSVSDSNRGKLELEQWRLEQLRREWEQYRDMEQGR